MQQPEASLDSLLKILSAPFVSYFLLGLIQRRKTLLKILRAIYKAVAQQQEEKRATQELTAVVANGNGHKDDYILLNLENVNARLKDTEGDVETVSARIDRERKERLDMGADISGELAKLTIRMETYRTQAEKDLSAATEKQARELKSYVDDSIKGIQIDMRRNFEDVKAMLRDMKPPAQPASEVSP